MHRSSTCMQKQAGYKTPGTVSCRVRLNSPPCRPGERRADPCSPMDKASFTSIIHVTKAKLSNYCIPSVICSFLHQPNGIASYEVLGRDKHNDYLLQVILTPNTAHACRACLCLLIVETQSAINCIFSQISIAIAKNNTNSNIIKHQL